MAHLTKQLLTWHLGKHPEYLGNNIASPQSLDYLKLLTEELLLPLEHNFDQILITYGFTSHPLLRYLQKNSPNDMGPNIDQHASMELNTKGRRICSRDGAACDFHIQGYEQRMNVVAKYIINNLPFDRLYFYGDTNPIHLSIGPNNNRYVLIRTRNKSGKRVNRGSATGSAALHFFDDL